MQKTYEPQVARMSRIGFLTQGKEANAFRNQVRSEPRSSPLSSVRRETRFGALGSTFCPWHLRDDLNTFFATNSAKKTEFESHLGGTPPVSRPTQIASLAA
jgi:hypothetical protein